MNLQMLASPLRLRNVLTVIFVIVMVLPLAFAKDHPEPQLKSASMPFYPRLAAVARISADVVVKFVVNARGDTENIEVSSGHPLLKEAAIDDVKTWKYVWPRSCDCRVKRRVIFAYIFGDFIESDDHPSVIVKWVTKERIEIEAGNHYVQP